MGNFVRKSAAEPRAPTGPGGRPSSPQQQPQRQSSCYPRDFPEVTSSGPSSLVPESLSSASSFQSLASTLSSKSSSGICADSVPGSPDKCEHSYIDGDIPDVDELISACAKIDLGAESPYHSFSSAAEASIVLAVDETQVVADETQDLADETRLVADETLQAFRTCPVLERTQAPPGPALEAKSSLIPFLTFEDSVLRKHQETLAEGAEFKSALSSLPQPEDRPLSPTPRVEAQTPEAAPLAADTPPSAFHKQLKNVLFSPDVTFEEVRTFDPESTPDLSSESSARTSDNFNATILRSPCKNDSGTTDECQAPLNQTVEIVRNDSKIDEEERVIVQETKTPEDYRHTEEQVVAPETEEVHLERESIVNKTQDIISEKDISDSNKVVVKEENNLKDALLLVEEKTIPSDCQNNIVQEIQGLEEDIIQDAHENTDKVDIKEEKTEIFHDDVKAEAEEPEFKVPIFENKVPQDKVINVQNTCKSPSKLFTPLKQSAQHNEEDTTEVLRNAHNVVASTPLPTKKGESPRTPKRKSALFFNEAQSAKPFSPQLICCNVPINIERVNEEKKVLNFDQTLAVNNSLEKTSFDATELVSKDNTEIIQNPLLNDSLNQLQPQEPEYESFKPQQQSTTLPFPNCDFQRAVQEAALAVAKEIDESIGNIEEDERFVSATTELFDDPTAFDFLSNAGSQPLNRGDRYDSLFMKFDPLAKRLSMMPQKSIPASPTESKAEVNEVKEESPITNTGTPTKNPAVAAIDRLLFYSPFADNAAERNAAAEAKQKKEEAEKQEQKVITVVDEKMAKELELVRSTVIQLETELERQKDDHKEKLEKQRQNFEDQTSHLQTKLSQMQSQLRKELTDKNQITVVVEEYEKSISRLVAEREKEKIAFEVEKQKLQDDLEIANQHLCNTEAAFTDVHSKYERLKSVVAAYKSNETVLKESITENQETIKTLENRYEQLKSHAMAQLEKANLELNVIRKQNDAETMKLKALVRKAELKSKSLEETVEQKIKENKELTQIIDEMIARVD